MSEAMTPSKQLTSGPSLISLNVFFLENQPRVSDSNGNSAQTICTPICEGKPTRLGAAPTSADVLMPEGVVAAQPTFLPPFRQRRARFSTPPVSSASESLQRWPIAAPLVHWE